MNISEIKLAEIVKNVYFTEDTLSVDLNAGRTITVPLAWYPRLLHATKEQLNNWKICGGGFGRHWSDLDEDLSAEGLFKGQLAPRKTKAVTKDFVISLRAVNRLTLASSG